jgi:hypothetical protein
MLFKNLGTCTGVTDLGTQLMTIGLYLMGGLVAAGITQLVDDAQSNNKDVEEVFH